MNHFINNPRFTRSKQNIKICNYLSVQHPYLIILYIHVIQANIAPFEARKEMAAGMERDVLKITFTFDFHFALSPKELRLSRLFPVIGAVKRRLVVWD